MKTMLPETCDTLASQVIENFEDNYEELREKVRSKLAEGGYSTKTPFDREKRWYGRELELDNWRIWSRRTQDWSFGSGVVREMTMLC